MAMCVAIETWLHANKSNKIFVSASIQLIHLAFDTDYRYAYLTAVVFWR